MRSRRSPVICVLAAASLLSLSSAAVVGWRSHSRKRPGPGSSWEIGPNPGGRMPRTWESLNGQVWRAVAGHAGGRRGHCRPMHWTIRPRSARQSAVSRTCTGRDKFILGLVMPVL
jgi:hypothetical protein